MQTWSRLFHRKLHIDARQIYAHSYLRLLLCFFLFYRHFISFNHRCTNTAAAAAELLTVVIIIFSMPPPPFFSMCLTLFLSLSFISEMTHIILNVACCSVGRSVTMSHQIFSLIIVIVDLDKGYFKIFQTKCHQFENASTD